MSSLGQRAIPISAIALPMAAVVQIGSMCVAVAHIMPIAQCSWEPSSHELMQVPQGSLKNIFCLSEFTELAFGKVSVRISDELSAVQCLS